jgi:LacI family transcriptional regulator
MLKSTKNILKKMPGTIRDIAVAAEVSIATVSLTLNNRPGVSDSTRKRVLAIAREISPDLVQKKLNTLRTGSIRFLKIVKHGHVINRDHDVFISSYIDGLQLEARNNGFNFEVNTYKASDIEQIIIEAKDSSLNGIIVLGTELNEQDLRPFEGIDLPVSVIDASYDFLTLDFVDMNNADSVYQIFKYFRQLGYEEIGLLTSPVEVRNFSLRSQAYKRAHKSFNIPLRNTYIYSVDSTYNGAYEDMRRILKQGAKLPPALFASNDIIAYGCIKALKESGYNIPEDISIIGFDNLPMCECMDPPLTTMDVSKKQIGAMAMRLIVNRINHEITAPAVKISISGELILRKSTQPFNTQ